MSTGTIVLAGIAAVALAAVIGGWVLRRCGSPASPATARHVPQSEDDVSATGNAAAGHVDADIPPVQLLARLYATMLAGQAPSEDVPLPKGGHADVVAAVEDVLGKIESQPRYMPRRPNLLPQLMRTINDPAATGRSIATLIARDPVLAGNLLRIANSALYRVQATPVESLERAVALVGTDGLRQMVAAALVQPVMGMRGGVFSHFPALIWEHTLLSAAAAADHAAQVERDDGFAAQLLGLVQGLGAVVVLRVIRDQYARRPTLRSDASVAAAMLDAWSAPVGQRLAARWGLSVRVQQALADQQRDAGEHALTPLGRSLRFGRLAGGLSMLCRQDRLAEPAALAVLDQTHASRTTVADIWARLRRGID